jgi:hypothetical protein
MPRPMPALSTALGARAKVGSQLASTGEIMRASAASDSVLTASLTLSALEALYEAVFVRMFADWEVFLEETFLRMMCGYYSSCWTPVLVAPACRSLADAKAVLFAGKQFLLWWNPAVTVTRAQTYFVQGPHELVTSSSLARLDAFSRVRHRITHGSADARTKFDLATMSLAGRRYRGGLAGRFLRDLDTSATPPVRWLTSIAAELTSLSAQIAP